MVQEVEKPNAVDPWDAYVLATCARLGPYAKVHLAPKLSGKDLGVALRASLPLSRNELMIAAIENQSGGFACPVLLTTRRIFWFNRTDRQGGVGAPTIHCEAMDYREVGDVNVRTSPSGDDAELAMGGRVLPLSRTSPGLARALAEVLTKLGAGSRSEIPPDVRSEEPALARRIGEIMPRVVEVNDRLRLVSGELTTFRNDLLAATPRVFVTPTFVASCVLVYLVLTARGVSWMSPTPADLLAWGANDDLRVVLGREYWRLPASVFLHGGLVHLGLNMWGLWSVGPLVERLYGNLGYAFLYLAAGVAGAVASASTPPSLVSVGASGAIFGVVGALLAFLVIRRKTVPPTVLVPLRSSVIGLVIFNTLLGVVVPIIDQSAHMGGLAAGFLGGLILAPPWPSRWSFRGVMRSALLSVFVGVLLVGASAAALRARVGSISAADRAADFEMQYFPARQEFLEIGLADIELSRSFDGKSDAEARVQAGRSARGLIETGRRNLARIDRIWTLEPELRASADLLASAQREQVDALEAVVRSESTGEREAIHGPDGFRDKASASNELVRRSEEARVRYLRVNGLLEEGPRGDD